MKMESNAPYNNCLTALYGLRRFGIKLGLFAIKKIVQSLGNPQDRFKCIHVAGTNGKGSIASALSSILQSSGYKVGLYTSPHLIRFNERIRINHQCISNDEVLASYEAVKSASDPAEPLTFFEYATAMAFYAFARQDVDWAVIETGMGGRLDATNIITPSLCVISNVSLEHQQYLGNTLGRIAMEKGGIIKTGTPLVTGVRQKNAISVLEKIAAAKSSAIYRYTKEFRVRRNKKETFTYFGIENRWPDMLPGLPGDHQIDNAALVLAACELLNRNQTNLSLADIKKGLAQNSWPGRLEIVSRSPLILIDGAHNLMGVRNLKKFLVKNLAGRKITLVAGILNDKPYKAMLRCLLPICGRAILTCPKIDRALPPEKLYAVAKKLVPDALVIPEVRKALAHAVKTVSPRHAICIAGSLYLVGEAKEALSESVCHKKTGN
jgi:dihydrofolate synthase/folylpolyglutamate synthase